jgi:hypothetical protein
LRARFAHDLSRTWNNRSGAAARVGDPPLGIIGLARLRSRVAELPAMWVLAMAEGTSACRRAAPEAYPVFFWPGREPFGDTLSMGSEESAVRGFTDCERDLGMRLPQIVDDAWPDLEPNRRGGGGDARTHTSAATGQRGPRLAPRHAEPRPTLTSPTR